MTGVETRSVSRDSLFLLAGIRIEQAGDTYRVRVRNLSDGGMMGEGNLRVQRGNRLDIELRNIGSIAGTVAWVQDDRFGVAFDEEIDSQSARKPAADGADTVEHAGTSIPHTRRAPPQPDPRDFRKV